MSIKDNWFLHGPNYMKPFQNLYHVYCAGPLFNASERRAMCEIADILEAEGFTPWVPHRDGMEFAQVRPYLVNEVKIDPIAAGQLLHDAVFALDVYQVVLGCGCLVCNLDGRVPDEGAVSEAAMAFMMGKPMVFYKEDVRSMINGRDNPLVVGLTQFRTVNHLQRIVPTLRTRIQEMEIVPSLEVACPVHLELPLRRGERLWEHLQSLGKERPTPQVADFVLELFQDNSLEGSLL